MSESVNNEITIDMLARSMRSKLAAIYGEGEAKAMVALIFHALKGWDRTALIINGDLPASGWIQNKTSDIMERLSRHEPIQYVLGEAYFYGMNFCVTPATLIPRPETEQLVDIIVKENKASDLRVLDIGTGSGAIAIALSRNLPFSQVSAIDISPEALVVARQNAENLHASVNFIEADVFHYSPQPDSFDIIVSNPPYVDDSEKSGMERNVLDYEPHSALFVPDDNPLLYYKRISEIAVPALAPKGSLYLEINPRHATELAAYLEEHGFCEVRTINDFRNLPRFIKCQK